MFSGGSGTSWWSICWVKHRHRISSLASSHTSWLISGKICFATFANRCSTGSAACRCTRYRRGLRMSIYAHRGPQALADGAPELQQILTRPFEAPGRFARLDIRRVTVWVTMRDGVRLATDLYLPPDAPSPAIAVRTPYGRANPKLVEPFIAQAQHGYIIVAQDCRGTGDSEPDSWDYYVYEREDSFDLVEWVTRQY